MVEDDNFDSRLKEYLESKNFWVDEAKIPKEAYNLFYWQKYNLCLFDIKLAAHDVFMLAKKIRAKDNNVPIIFLVSTNENILKGFNTGADDCIQKPFNPAELLVRIEAVLRRSSQNTEDNTVEFTIGKYFFNKDKRTLIKGEHLYKLTPKETQLMHLLVLNKNKLLERSFALKTIWREDSHFTGRSMDVFITKLRKYIQHDNKLEIINVHGSGFKLVINP